MSDLHFQQLISMIMIIMIHLPCQALCLSLLIKHFRKEINPICQLLIVMAVNKFQVWNTILIILVLNILLPTADVITDLILIGKLYRGVYECKWSEEIEYEKCRDVGPEKYCSVYPEKVSNI